MLSIFNFARSMLKKELKKSIFYTLTILFSITMCFVFLNIINNEYLFLKPGIVPYLEMLESGQSGFAAVEIPLSSMISFAIVIFCCSMILSSTNFYISKKHNEFASLSLSGISSFRIAFYLLCQICILLCIAIPIGVGVGCIIIPLLNQYMYDYIGIIDAPANYIPVMAVVQTIVVVLVMVVMIIVVSSGYVYRHNIQEFLGETRTVSKTSIPPLKSAISYFILYILGVVMIYMADHQATVYAICIGIGMSGVSGLVGSTIPKLVAVLKNRFLLTKRYALIYVSNVSYTLKSARILIVFTAIVVIGMTTIMATQIGNPREFVTAIVGYVVMLILLITSIVYNVCNEIQQRVRLFDNLWNIGYTKKELKKVVRNEVLYFYIILLLLPLLYVGVVGSRYMYYSDMDISVLIIVIGSYILPILASSLLTYRVYYNTVISPIGGEK